MVNNIIYNANVFCQMWKAYRKSASCMLSKFSKMFNLLLVEYLSYIYINCEYVIIRKTNLQKNKKEKQKTKQEAQGLLSKIGQIQALVPLLI